MRRKSLVLLAVLLFGATAAIAQDDTGDTDGDDSASNEPTSTINYFAVLCEDQIVFSADGTMESGFDVYYQAFSAAGGGGTALTGLQQVNVSGDYAISTTTQYSNGTLPPNQVGSYFVAIGAEGNPDNTLFTDTVDDVQDGCAEPQNPVSDTTTTGGTADTTGDSTGSGTIEEGRFVDTGESAILSPFGGVLNPGYIPPEKPAVQIGAREEFTFPRQETPGLIFAECEDYPVAEPGIIYDTDEVTVFWSWFAKTREQLQQHIENVDYSVTYYQSLELPKPITRTEIREIRGLYWVFYYSRLGNLRPGEYYVQYQVRWDEPHFDGFTEYGPGTDNPVITSGCEWDVLPNPEGEPVSHNSWPYQN